MAWPRNVLAVTVFVPMPDAVVFEACASAPRSSPEMSIAHAAYRLGAAFAGGSQRASRVKTER